MKYHSLITKFKNYLSKKRLSKKSVKNYVSDIRRFLKWFQTMEQWNNGTMEQWNKNQFANYRSHLLDSKIPLKTVNRYLSSLRQFGGFLTAAGLTTNNPAEELESVKNHLSNAKLKLSSKEKILEQFRQSLQNQRLSKKTITNYISDINQFLEFLKNES